MLSTVSQFFLVACLVVNVGDVHELTNNGRKLSPEAAAAIEIELKEEPNDLAARTTLLGYYSSGKYRNKTKAEAYRQHVLWLIENSPQADVLGIPQGRLDAYLDGETYWEAKKIWLKHLDEQGEKLAILRNGSKFFAMSEPGKTEDLLKYALAIAPKDPEWSRALGQHYRLQLIRDRGDDNKRRETALTALEYFEKAYELTEEGRRDLMLKYLGEVAFAAGETEKAKKYAELMLEHPEDGYRWNYGNAVFHGHHLLGQIALAAGDVNEAKNQLIDAAATSGSPQLGSFGPSMQLADALIKAGETETVLEYFDLCRRFWDRGAEKLDTWEKAVRAGIPPDFGPNLRR